MFSVMRFLKLRVVEVISFFGFCVILRKSLKGNVLDLLSWLGQPNINSNAL